MEARTKIIAAVAVIMMCAAGLVGAGYAYTATTQNDGNSASSEYIVLSQDGAGAYRFADDAKVYYDTVNYMDRSVPETPVEKTRYDLNNPITLEAGATDYKAVKIGNTFTIDATQTPGDRTDLTALTCTIAKTSGDITLVDNYLFILKITNNATTTYHVWNGSVWATPTFTIAVNDGTPDTYYNTTVEAFYGYAIGTEPTGFVEPDDEPLDAVAITFTVQPEPINNGFIVALSGVTVGQALSASEANISVKNAAGDDVTSNFEITWMTGGSVVANTTQAAAETTYTVIISGTGANAGMYGEASFTTPAAP